MKKYILFITIILASKIYAQDTIRTNPIVFVEYVFGGGGSFGDYSGFVYGGSANFQIKKHLFTVRYTENPEFKLIAVSAGYIAFPFIQSNFINTEIAVMYGKRYIENSVSYSFSGGICGNDFAVTYKDANDNIREATSRHYGFAYELNVKWFNSKKERYKLYMMVPITKPTAFARSFGFKLLGNISERSYIGLAITYGFGLHKQY